MCSDSLGVANHSRGHHPSADSGSVARTDIYIKPYQWFRATGHFLHLPLGTVKLLVFIQWRDTNKHFTIVLTFCNMQYILILY